MMTGQYVPDVKCIVLQEPTTVAFVSVVYVAWTTTVHGMKSSVMNQVTDITEKNLNLNCLLRGNLECKRGTFQYSFELGAVKVCQCAAKYSNQIRIMGIASLQRVVSLFQQY